MQFKYVDPKSVERLIGRYAPINAFMLARLIDEALDNTNQGYVHTQSDIGRLRSDPPEISKSLIGVADRMLTHNYSNTKAHLWEFYDELDFDLLHKIDNKANGSGITVSTTVNAYFFHTQFSRPKSQRRVVFHLQFHKIQGTHWDISFPIQAIMKGFPHIENEYVGYLHGIALIDKDGNLSDGQHNYIGVTKRNWLKRMSEHMAEIRGGSSKTFHAAWRKYIGCNDVRLLSELVVVNHTFEQIMEWEEFAVDHEMAAGTSLNMIPGGFKGMKFLYEHRLTNSVRVSLEERDKAIEKHQSLNPRAGIPNLIISQLWKNPEYAEQVICGHAGRLSSDQVKNIRKFKALEISLENITELVGAKNVLQVARVLSGKTYSRIK